MGVFSRKSKQNPNHEPGVFDTPVLPVVPRQSSENTLGSDEKFDPVSYQHKPTGLRVFTALLYLIALVFLILVEIGNISKKPVIRSTYFLQINLSNIIPASVPNSSLINSIAQTLGLYDFYQVGLWNFFAGLNGEGITYCSPRTTAYWFNPVEIILSELLVGATIALPTNITDVLHLVQIASLWMFACFIVGAVLTFLCIFLIPLGFSKRPRWEHKARRVFLRQLPITVLSFLAVLFTAAGRIIATVMFLIFRDTFRSATEVNIGAKLGTEMLAFMWTAVGLLLLGFIMQIGTCCGVCCCTGKRKAEKKAAKRQSKAIAVQQEKTESPRTI